MILRMAGGVAALYLGQYLIEQSGRCLGGLVEEALCCVVLVDGEFLLADDVAVIGIRGHVMERDAGLLLAVDEHPVDRAAATIFWQERTMQVQATLGGNIENGGLDHVAIVERENDIGPELRYPMRPDRVVDVVGGEDGDIFRSGQLCHRAEPDVLGRVVLVGEDSDYLDTAFQQRLDADAPDVVICQDHCFHIVTSEPFLPRGTSLSFSLPTTCCTK